MYDTTSENGDRFDKIVVLPDDISDSIVSAYQAMETNQLSFGLSEIQKTKPLHLVELALGQNEILATLAFQRLLEIEELDYVVIDAIYFRASGIIKSIFTYKLMEYAKHGKSGEAETREEFRELRRNRKPGEIKKRHANVSASLNMSLSNVETRENLNAIVLGFLTFETASSGWLRNPPGFDSFYQLLKEKVEESDLQDDIKEVLRRIVEANDTIEKTFRMIEAEKEK